MSGSLTNSEALIRRIKASEDTNPSVAAHNANTGQADYALNSLAKEYEELTKEWDLSLHKHELIRTIREKIFPQNITIDSALCLGHDFIEHGLKTALPGKIRKDTLIRAKIPWEDQCGAEEGKLKCGVNGFHNWGLYQLIVFETVLQYLRKPPSPA